MTSSFQPDRISAIVDIRFSQERGKLNIELREAILVGAFQDASLGFFVQVIFGNTSLYFLNDPEATRQSFVQFHQSSSLPNPSDLNVPVDIKLFSNIFGVRGENELSTLIGHVSDSLKNLISSTGTRSMEEGSWLLLYRQTATLSPAHRPIALDHLPYRALTEMKMYTEDLQLPLNTDYDQSQSIAVYSELLTEWQLRRNYDFNLGSEANLRSSGDGAKDLEGFVQPNKLIRPNESNHSNGSSHHNEVSQPKESDQPNGFIQSPKVSGLPATYPIIANVTQKSPSVDHPSRASGSFGGRTSTLVEPGELLDSSPASIGFNRSTVSNNSTIQRPVEARPSKTRPAEPSPVNTGAIYGNVNLVEPVHQILEGSRSLIGSNSPVLNISIIPKPSKARPTINLDEPVELLDGSPASVGSNRSPVLNNSAIPRLIELRPVETRPARTRQVKAIPTYININSNAPEFLEGCPASVGSSPASNNATNRVRTSPYGPHTSGSAGDQTGGSDWETLPRQSLGRCVIDGRPFNKYLVAFKPDKNLSEVGFELSEGSPMTLISVKAGSRSHLCGFKVGDVIIKIEDWDINTLGSQIIITWMKNAAKPLWLEFGRPIRKRTFLGAVQNIFSCRPNDGNSDVTDSRSCFKSRSKGSREKTQARRIIGSITNRLNMFKRKKKSTASVVRTETVSQASRARETIPFQFQCQTSLVHDSSGRGLATVRHLPLPRPPFAWQGNGLRLNYTYDKIDDSLPDAELDSEDYDDPIIEANDETERRRLPGESVRATTLDQNLPPSVKIASSVSATDYVGTTADTSGYITSNLDSEAYVASVVELQSPTNSRAPHLSHPSTAEKNRKRKRLFRDDDKENATTADASSSAGSNDQLDEANVARFFNDSSLSSDVDADREERTVDVKMRKSDNQTFVVERNKNPSPHISSSRARIPIDSSATQKNSSAVLAELPENVGSSDDIRHDGSRGTFNSRSNQNIEGKNSKDEIKPGRKNHHESKTPSNSYGHSLKKLVGLFTFELYKLETKFRGGIKKTETFLEEFLKRHGVTYQFKVLLDLISLFRSTNEELCTLVSLWLERKPNFEEVIQFSIRQLDAYKRIFSIYVKKLGNDMRRLKILVSTREANISMEKIEDMLLQPAKHFKRILIASSDFTEPDQTPYVGAMVQTLIECWRLMQTKITEMPKVKRSKSSLRKMGERFKRGPGRSSQVQLRRHLLT